MPERPFSDHILVIDEYVEEAMLALGGKPAEVGECNLRAVVDTQSQLEAIRRETCHEPHPRDGHEYLLLTRTAFHFQIRFLCGQEG